MVAIYRANRLPPLQPLGGIKREKAAKRPRRERDDLSAFESGVMRMIEGAAARGEASPTNREICEEFGLASLSSAVRILDKLSARGLIAIERFQIARVVTITATGQSTARPANEQKHWRAA
jgi:DNA-binding MarR family transcriptional regulator